MSSNELPDLNLLYRLTLKEIQNDDIQHLNPDFYKTLSHFLGKLKTEEYDGLEAKAKTKLVNLTSSLTALLINIRLEKISRAKNSNRKNFLDGEKFIVDSNQEMAERKDLIIQSILNGKPKLLESITTDYKTKPTIIRFLKETEQILCVDSEKYGPFKPEDVATLPNEDAQQLISNNIVLSNSAQLIRRLSRCLS